MRSAISRRGVGVGALGVDQRHRVDPDRVRDDELLAGEADAVDGQEREREGLRRDCRRSSGSGCGSAAAGGRRPRSRSKASTPSKTSPVSPSAQETVTGSPVLQHGGGVAGADDARECRARALTIAAWQVRPPRSVTIAAACLRIGSQSGSVIAVTRTEPGRNSRDLAQRCRGARTRPAPICVPTARPVHEHRPALASGGRLDELRRVALRVRRLGPRLDDEELARAPVLRPLDVHRRGARRRAAL